MAKLYWNFILSVAAGITCHHWNKYDYWARKVEYRYRLWGI